MHQRTEPSFKAMIANMKRSREGLAPAYGRSGFTDHDLARTDAVVQGQV
jgi:hypothetical protein